MLKITGLYTALIALIYIFLCYKVVFYRRKNRVELADGGDPQVLRFMRAQANAAEYMPIALILFAIAEANAAPLWLLHGVGIVFVIARVIHPMGFVNKKGISFGRFYGTLFTWLIILGLSILNLLYFFNIL
ncbi:MAPEG family protein [Marinicella sp. W31]|uniref:MAPEG family protein n=1 Tax=Marinicella sp. W31 TaxID=3023713 RepID=UPI003757D5C7